MITDFSKAFLIAAARRSLEKLVVKGEALTADDLSLFPEDVRREASAYVSIWRWPQQDPRASHGYPWCDKPLMDVVMMSVRGCAVHETIFPRLKSQELNNVTIRIHILGAAEEIKDITDASMDGCALFLDYLSHSAIVLPDVIELASWDALETASQLCLKSGLPGDMWLIPGLKLKKIKVLTFGESVPGSNKIADF